LLTGLDNRNIIIIGIDGVFWTSSDGGITIVKSKFTGLLSPQSIKFHPSLGKTPQDLVRVIAISDGKCGWKAPTEPCGNDLYERCGDIIVFLLILAYEFIVMYLFLCLIS
jgi:hypothetical protein